LYHLGARPGENLMDNWYFPDPVNQRRQKEYSEYNGYTIDRWRLEFIGAGSKIQVTDTGIRLIPADGGWVLLGQLMEGLDRISGFITLSFLVDGQLISATFQQDLSLDYLFHVAEIGDYTIGISGKDLSRVSIMYKGTAPALLQAAKLELGTVQTLAHQDASGNWVLSDPPPNKALESAKCQRYQIFGELVGSKLWHNTSYAGSFFVPTPVSLRIKPSLIGSIKYYKTHEEPADFPSASSVVLNKMGNGIYVYVDSHDESIHFDEIYGILIDTQSGFDANL